MAKIKKADVVILKSLPAPPQAVKDVLVASLVLLGDDVDSRTDYRRVMKSFSNLEKRSAALDASKVALNVALGAKVLIKDVTEDELVKKCKAAHSVFMWNQQVIDTVLSQYSEEEISRTVPSTVRQPESVEAGCQVLNMT